MRELTTGCGMHHRARVRVRRRSPTAPTPGGAQERASGGSRKLPAARLRGARSSARRWSGGSPSAASPASARLEDRRGRRAAHAAGGEERVNAEELVDEAAGDAEHGGAAVLALDLRAVMGEGEG